MAAQPVPFSPSVFVFVQTKSPGGSALPTLYKISPSQYSHRPFHRLVCLPATHRHGRYRPVYSFFCLWCLCPCGQAWLFTAPPPPTPHEREMVKSMHVKPLPHSSFGRGSGEASGVFRVETVKRFGEGPLGSLGALGSARFSPSSLTFLQGPPTSLEPHTVRITRWRCSPGIMRLSALSGIP